MTHNINALIQVPELFDNYHFGSHSLAAGSTMEPLCHAGRIFGPIDVILTIELDNGVRYRFDGYEYPPPWRISPDDSYHSLSGTSIM